MKLFLSVFSMFTPTLIVCDFPGIFSKNKAELVSMTPPGPVQLISKSAPLPVYCTAKDARRLDFRVNGLQANATKINRTTILTYFSPEDPGLSYVDCLLDNDNKGKCRLEVYVGFEPQRITDFNCISQNLETFDCFWKENPENPIRTIYSLEYFVDKNLAIQTCCGGGPFPDLNSDNFKCSFKICDPFSMPSMPCCQRYDEDILLNTVIHFELFASINVTNSRGTLGNHSYPDDIMTVSWKYDYQHDSLVRPNVPENLQILHLNSTETQVSFDVSNKFRDFIKRRPLEYKVEICSVENCDSRQLGSIAQHGRFRVILSNLQPWTEYTIRVKLRVQAAKHLRYWSEYAEVKTRTPARPPTETPRIDPASFQIIKDVKNSGSGAVVRLHWIPVQEANYNGPGFGYQIRTSSAKEALTHKVDKYFVDLSNVSLNTTILISAENDEGKSEPTHVFVPDWESVKDIAPNNVENIISPDETETVISWTAPFNSEAVDNYTIFWCLEPLTPGCPYLCDGQIGWKTVFPKKDVYQYNVSQPGHIGVAANTRAFSSGVVWPTWEHCPAAVPWFMDYPWIILVPLIVVLMGVASTFCCCKVIQWYRKKLAFFDKLGGDIGDFVIPGIDTGKAGGNKIKDDCVTKRSDLHAFSQALESSLIPFADDVKQAVEHEMPLPSDELLPKKHSSDLAEEGETHEDPGYSKVSRFGTNKMVLIDMDAEKTIENFDNCNDRSRMDSYISVEEATNFKEVTMEQTEDNYISIGSISRQTSLDVTFDQPKDSYISIGSMSRRTSINATPDLQQDAYISVCSISKISPIDITSKLPKSKPCSQNSSILPKKPNEDCNSINSDQTRRLCEEGTPRQLNENSSTRRQSTDFTSINAKNDSYTSMNSILQMNTNISSTHSKDDIRELPNEVLYPTLKHPKIEPYFSKDVPKLKANDEGYIKIYSISRQSSVDPKLPNIERKLHPFENNYILPATILECPKFVDSEYIDKSQILGSMPLCNNGYSKIVSALIQSGQLSQPGYSKVGLEIKAEVDVS